MATDRVKGYAHGIVAMARGEDVLGRVEDELLAVSRALETSPDLRSTLVDPQLPIEKKQAVIVDLVGGRASSLTVSVLELIVAQNRVSDLPDIAMAVAEAAAASRNRAVAEVRSAVPLDSDTVQRLTASLGRATGKEVEVKVIVDPTVIGGIVSRVGDTVIDGSIAHRLSQVRHSVQSSR